MCRGAGDCDGERAGFPRSVISSPFPLPLKHGPFRRCEIRRFASQRMRQEGLAGRTARDRPGKGGEAPTTECQAAGEGDRRAGAPRGRERPTSSASSATWNGFERVTIAAHGSNLVVGPFQPGPVLFFYLERGRPVGLSFLSPYCVGIREFLLPTQDAMRLDTKENCADEMLRGCRHGGHQNAERDSVPSATSRAQRRPRESSCDRSNRPTRASRM